MLSRLKLDTLRKLSKLCGLETSGTKSRLIENIQKASSHRSRIVLSVDMGIRNLAYAVVDTGAADHVSDFESKRGECLKVLAWDVVNLHPEADPDLDLELDSQVENLAGNFISSNEMFGPVAAASLAYRTFIGSPEQKRSDGIVTMYKPDLIAIERQRHRTVGAKSVFEWTIRVNTFESAIHGLLHGLIRTGIIGSAICAIPPVRVRNYWFRSSNVRDKSSSIASSSTILKRAKVDLVRSWIAASGLTKETAYEDTNITRLCPTIEFGSSLNPIVEVFNGKVSARRRQKSNIGEDVSIAKVGGRNGKLDDLADSLVQAVSIAEWQRNRVIVKDIIEGDANRKLHGFGREARDHADEDRITRMLNLLESHEQRMQDL
ncbi:mitochondrial resolvase Ydc2 [Dipodascopsis uninucleata]